MRQQRDQDHTEITETTMNQKIATTLPDNGERSDPSSPGTKGHGMDRSPLSGIETETSRLIDVFWRLVGVMAMAVDAKTSERSEFRETAGAENSNH